MKKLLVFVVLLAVGAGAAYHFGYLDRLGLGGLRVRLIPKDPALLAYFAPDTRELMLVQATAASLPLSEASQRKLAQEVEAMYTKTGIHSLKDVDALAAADGLGVVRGRFDWKRLSAYLQSQGYTLTELEGVPAAVKPQAGDLALDGHYLLVGPRALLEQAISRKRRGEGLGNDSPIVKALDEIGWKHALVGGMVSGSRLATLQEGVTSQVQSLLGAFDLTAEELALRTTAITGSNEKGRALLATLEVMRKAALVGSVLDSTPEARMLMEALQKATLEVDAQGTVRGVIRFPPTLVDQASASLSPGSTPDPLQFLSMPSEEEASAASGPPPASSNPPAPAPGASIAAPLTVDWKPPVLGLVLLVIALVTISAQTRPGLFNVLFHPLFLLPFLVATLGVPVLRWTGHVGGVFDVLALPMPEWHHFVSFPVAQPLTLSAAIPLLFALVSIPASWLRRFAAGLGVGFSAYLAVKAFVGTPLPLLPPAVLLAWYAGNALAALVIARFTVPPRRAKAKK